MASYSNVGHKGPREFWVETQNYWDVYLFTILVHIYKTVTCIDYSKWFIAVCWMIYPGIYKYIWNYLCKLISSESSYDNSLMNFNKHLWNIFFLWDCSNPFTQYNLSTKSLTLNLNFFFMTFGVMSYYSKQTTNVEKVVQTWKWSIIV